MSFKIFYDKDCDINLVRQKKVAVIGYGSQGHAHALNLKDSEVDVVVGLNENSPSIEKATNSGLKTMTPSEASKWADIIMLLIPDEVMGEVYDQSIKPNLTEDKSLCFAHGFNIHYNKIVPPKGVEVFMVAPKGPGHTVRRQFEEGSGVPCLIASLSENQETLELAKSYAKAIGGSKTGIFKTSFKEETETDLFGEQSVLCGGVSELIRCGFETLVEAGYSPVMAYFECLHEVKLITDLVFEGGISNMHYSVSNTAEYGDYVSGKEVIGADTKENMRKVLKRIQSGEFADQWISEHKAGKPNFLKYRKEAEDHQIEQIGKVVREKMGFNNKKTLVDKTKN